MPEKGFEGHEHDLTPEQRHQRAGSSLGEEYYRRISDPHTDSYIPPEYPLFVAEDLRTMEPTYFEIFMTSAANRFQMLAKEDLMKQGKPENQAARAAFGIATAFQAFATAIYENNLGVGRSPMPPEGSPPLSAPQGPNTPQSGR